MEKEYVTFALDSVWQVESFLSTAVDQLLDDANLALNGIFNGGWLSPGDGDIDGEIFMKRVAGALRGSSRLTGSSARAAHLSAVRVVPQKQTEAPAGRDRPRRGLTTFATPW